MNKTTSTRSAELFKEAQQWLPGGVSRNTLLRKPHPIYVASGQGCRVTDVDGAEYIDFAGNMASLIHGHAHPAIVEAITKQLHLGTAFSLATESEVRYAEDLTSRAPSFDKIRFVNSGTEAVMAGMKAARAFTGRPKIAKVEGSYHGAYDYAEVSQAPAPKNWGDAQAPESVPLAHGTPQGVLSDVIILPFNEPEKALARLKGLEDEIACVLLDPIPHRVGLTAVAPEFVAAMRKWTQDNGALLMFDEVITFRSEFGGMQQRYEDRPDLTSLGKMIGGGFPVGALAGREEVMQVFQSMGGTPLLPHSGTFSANPISMTAGRIALNLFDQAAVTRLNALGDRARAGIAKAFTDADFPATVTGAGSMLRMHMKAETPYDYRSAWINKDESEALRQLLEGMRLRGVLLVQTGTAMLSTPMTEAETDHLCESVAASLSGVDRALLSNA